MIFNAFYFFRLIVRQKKPSLLLVSLFWWAAPLSLWIGFIFFVLFKGVADYFEDKKPHLKDYDLIYPVTGTEFCFQTFEIYKLKFLLIFSIFHCFLFCRCDELQFHEGNNQKKSIRDSKIRCIIYGDSHGL